MLRRPDLGRGNLEGDDFGLLLLLLAGGKVTECTALVHMGSLS